MGAGARLSGIGVGAVILAIILAIHGPASAVDPFEIQVYDGTADAPGEVGLEAHVNYVASGLTSARPPELPQNHQAHFALEPSYGVLPTWEVGGYLLAALRPDGTFDVVGGKARSKLVTPNGWSAHARLGLNLELSYLREAYDAERWGGELRPIASWDSERVTLAINPIVGVSLRGGPLTFEPAAMALLKFPGLVSFGVEYYAELGPLSSPAPLHAQEHYLFEVANLLRSSTFELNVGVGQGLTGASNPFVAKVIVGYRL
jgi:hypothetical protein